MFYAVFHDLTAHYVGPFPDVAACDAHAAACAGLGDGAEYRGAISEAEAKAAGGVDISSPEADLDLIRAVMGV